MKGSLMRIGAVTRAELLFRFRKMTAVVTLLAVAAAVYLIVPDVGSGRTLMQVDGHRVLYSSTAVALGTGIFCAIFLSLFGYYLVSNAFLRDIESRTGFILAAGPVRNSEYVGGKFLGSVLYLGAVMLACMLSAIVMFLLRGDGPLEPLVFLRLYCLLVVPAVVMGAAAAVAFEALPVLSGRFGDVLYFLLWGALLSVQAVLVQNRDGPRWIEALDITGFVPTLEFLQDRLHTQSISVGSSPFNAARGPVALSAVDWGWDMVAQRAAALLLPAALLWAATGWFHRFNPARITVSARRAKKNLLAEVSALLKPFTPPVAGWILPLRRRERTGKISFAGAVRADVFVTLSLSPLIPAAAAVCAILSLALDIGPVRSGLIPGVIAVLVIALSDIATRDKGAGMLRLLLTMPNRRGDYVAWKFASALAVTLIFTLIPAARLASGGSSSAALSLLIGSCFVAGSAVGFGVLAGSRKLFIVIFLMLLYVSLNAGDLPALDFAGFQARATPAVQAGYGVLAMAVLALGQARHAALLKKM